MIAAIALAATLATHQPCVIESRDHTTTRAGQLAYFEVNNTCLMRGLSVVARDGRTTLTGTNPHAGHDLTVAIRVPRDTRPGDVFRAYGYAPVCDRWTSVVIFRPVTITHA